MPVPGRLRQGGAALFSCLQKARTTAYERGIAPSHKVEGVRVVSVGNLRVGGTGKTPLTIYLAEQLSSRGAKVAVVSRGYRGSLSKSGGLVSTGEGPLVTSREAGDEPYLMAKRLSGVAVRVGRHRAEQAAKARDDGAEVVILDDGFQHRRLYRDLDIVLTVPGDDADALLPAGPLREPRGALDRADLIGGLEEEWNGEEAHLDFRFRHSVSGLVSIDQKELPPDAYRGARAHLLCGIAEPERFVRTARNEGFGIAGKTCYRDHHWFTPSEIDAVARQAKSNAADIILTTEKDMVRLKALDAGLPIAAIRIEVVMVSGESLLEKRLTELTSR